MQRVLYLFFTFSSFNLPSPYAMTENELKTIKKRIIHNKKLQKTKILKLGVKRPQVQVLSLGPENPPISFEIGGFSVSQSCFGIFPDI